MVSRTSAGKDKQRYTVCEKCVRKTISPQNTLDLLSYVEQGWYRHVKYRLQMPVDVDAMQAKTKRTPLIMASCLKNHRTATNILRCLLASGADPLRRDCEGMTALSHSCASGNYQAVRLLLETGECDISSADLYGLTPMHHAVRGGSAAVVAILSAALKSVFLTVDPRGPEGETPLMEAIKLGRIDSALKLKKAGASLKRAAERGFSVDAVLEAEKVEEDVNGGSWKPEGYSGDTSDSSLGEFEDDGQASSPASLASDFLALDREEVGEERGSSPPSARTKSARRGKSQKTHDDRVFGVEDAAIVGRDKTSEKAFQGFTSSANKLKTPRKLATSTSAKRSKSSDQGDTSLSLFKDPAVELSGKKGQRLLVRSEPDDVAGSLCPSLKNDKQALRLRRNLNSSLPNVSDARGAGRRQGKGRCQQPRDGHSEQTHHTRASAAKTTARQAGQSWKACKNVQVIQNLKGTGRLASRASDPLPSQKSSRKRSTSEDSRASASGSEDQASAKLCYPSRAEVLLLTSNGAPWLPIENIAVTPASAGYIPMLLQMAAHQRNCLPDAVTLKTTFPNQRAVTASDERPLLGPRPGTGKAHPKYPATFSVGRRLNAPTQNQQTCQLGRSFSPSFTPVNFSLKRYSLPLHEFH